MNEKQNHIDRNYEAFKRLLPELLVTHAGKAALMRNEELVEIFDSMADAERAGRKLYSDGMYSVQQITDRTVDLGYFSHAVHFG
jgi:hypothetical protein